MKRNQTKRSKNKNTFVPVTPGGSLLQHLEGKTEKEAWDKLLKDTSHMHYKTKENLIERGYTVEKFPF